MKTQMNGPRRWPTGGESRSVPSARPKPPRPTLGHLAARRWHGVPAVQLDPSRNSRGQEVSGPQAEDAQALRSQSRPAPRRSLRNPEPKDAALTCPPRQARYGSGQSSQRLLLEPRAARQTQCPPGPAHPGERPTPARPLAACWG